MAELTHTTIKNLAVEKRSEVPDESYRHGKRRKGLMLQTNPSGNHVFLYRRLVNGTRYGFTLGRFPELSLALAREMVDEINDYDGTPQEAWEALYAPKKPEQPAEVMTVGRLIHKYAVECETVRKNRAWKAQRTVLINELKPYLDIPADKLTHEHVQAVVQSCLDRGSPRVAQEVRKQIAGMFARAMGRHRKKRVVVAKEDATTAANDEKWLDLKENPADPITAPIYKPKSHHMKGKELLAFPKRLAASAVRDDVKQILLLQMQTFCRVGEVAGMAWEELDLKRRVWVIPGERYKTGVEHTVMLSTQSTVLLRRLKKNSESRYVFPMPRFPHKPMTSEEVAHRISYARPSLKQHKDFTSHSLRRSGATWLAAEKCPYEVRERLLGHKLDTEGDMSERYNMHLYLGERREWTQKWCDYLEGGK